MSLSPTQKPTCQTEFIANAQIRLCPNDDNDNGLVDAEPPFAAKDDEIIEGHVSFFSISPTSGAVKFQRLTGLEQETSGTRRVYADKSGLSPIDEGHEYAVSGSSSLERDFFVNPVGMGHKIHPANPVL